MLMKEVWTKYGKSIRIGKIVKTKIIKGWKYVQVIWASDDIYKSAEERKCELRNVPFEEKVWYRIDEVNFLNKERLSRQLAELDADI
jgi:hypothetical protein